MGSRTRDRPLNVGLAPPGRSNARSVRVTTATTSSTSSSVSPGDRLNPASAVPGDYAIARLSSPSVARPASVTAVRLWYFAWLVRQREANGTDPVEGLAQDMPRFASAVPALIKAGFAPSLRCITNDGRATEYSFLRDSAKFEFFVLESVDGHLRYYDFGTGPPTQAVASIAEQALVPFEFVGRTWLKHADHEAELTAMYGDWRTPDPDWWWMDDVAIVERTEWTRHDEMQWAGDFGDLGAAKA
jgi:hypothetical protein